MMVLWGESSWRCDESRFYISRTVQERGESAPVHTQVRKRKTACGAQVCGPTTLGFADAWDYYMAFHPRDLFSRRLLGPSNTLSATFDTLLPFSGPTRALLVEGLSSCDLFVCDCQNFRVQSLTPSGDLKFEFGGRGSGHGKFEYPTDIAAHDGRLFVADSANQRVEAFSVQDGSYAFTVASASSSRYYDGRLLNWPIALAVCRKRRHLYVCDGKGARVLVFKLCADKEVQAPYEQAPDEQAVYAFSIGVGAGGGRGEGELDWPQGVAVSPDGEEVFVADSGHHRVQVFAAEDGAFRRMWGRMGSLPGEMRGPVGIAVAAGRVFVSEHGHRQERIQAFCQGAEATGPPVVIRPSCMGRACGALHHVSAAPDGRLLVCDEGRHAVYHVVPNAARLRRWRVAARLAAVLIQAQARARERLYAPGGKGYMEALASFERGVQDASQHNSEQAADRLEVPDVT